jgi:hypothetical protein
VVVEQLVHRALVRLPKGLIKRLEACVFVNGVKDLNVKQHLIMGCEGSLVKPLTCPEVRGCEGGSRATSSAVGGRAGPL